MPSYLGSLVQFSPAAGRAGRCRQMSLCVGSTRRVPATLGLPRTGVSVLSPSTLLRLPAALYGAGPALSAVRFQVLHKSMDSVAPVFCAFPGLSSSGSQRLGRPLPGCGAPGGSWPLAATLPAADVDHPESQEVFRRNQGLFAVWKGVASLELSLPLSPPPCLLPPAGMGRLFLWSFSVPLFCEPPACVRAG